MWPILEGYGGNRSSVLATEDLAKSYRAAEGLAAPVAGSQSLMLPAAGKPEYQLASVLEFQRTPVIL